MVIIKENILNKFNIDSKSTYLLKIDKTNFLVGKNNSGKSYFLRFLLTNSLKIYNDIIELSEDLKTIILSDSTIDFEFFSKFNNVKFKKIYEEYYRYIMLLDKADKAKIDTGATYFSGYNTKAYRYNNENELLIELRPLFDFLNVKKRIDELNIQIIAKYEEIKSKILKDFKETLISQLDILEDEEIIKFGSKMGQIIEKEQKNQQSSYEVSKNYLQPMCEPRGLSAPLKTKNRI